MVTARTADSRASLEELRAALRDVPDFPRPGIQFKDITPLLADPRLFASAIAALAEPYVGHGVTHVAGIESRGFILGAPIAEHLGAGFVPLRKPGKLPSKTHRVDYALEYGTDALEAHIDACHDGAKVLLVDDVLATGGTAAAATMLLDRLGATVAGCAFLLQIDALGGADRLAERPVTVLLHA